MSGYENRNLSQIEALKNIRADLNISQKRIAEFFDIPLRTWEEWESGRRKMPEYLLRLMLYRIRMEQVSYYKRSDVLPNDITQNVEIIHDEQGHCIVVINDIRFQGRQRIKWADVETFLREYIGKSYDIIEIADKVYIGADFPDELKGSEDTRCLKGSNAKAKANATSKIPLLLQYATNKRWQDNYKVRHGTDAKYGWYRFTARFALPIYTNNGVLQRYNIYRIEMLLRHVSDQKLYLYDMVNVKKEKETGTPSGQ